MGPPLTAKTQLQNSASIYPAELAAVALIDASACAATGSMSLSWWHAEVAAGRAPQPVIRQPRFTRWRLVDVHQFWHEQACGALNNDGTRTRAAKASAAATAKRLAVAEQQEPA